MRSLQIIAVGVLVHLLGCASTNFDWRSPRLGKYDARRGLPADSIAGQIANVRASVSESQNLSAERRETIVKDFEAKLADGATPLAVKLEVVRAIGELRPNSVRGLEAATRDSSAALRAATCRALGQYNSGEALELLEQIVATDTSNDVRLSAVRSLGKFKSPAAVEALADVLDDPDPAVQYVAMQALQRSTGSTLGMDVRKWKAAVKDPSVIMAGRSGLRR